MDDINKECGLILTWCDLTKLGKVSAKDLDSLCDLVEKAMKKYPSKSAAFITCPVLKSEKVGNSVRAEMKRVEAKLDAKHLDNHLVTLRMDVPASSLKRVPLVFYGWVVLPPDCEENMFRASQLLADQTPRQLVPFAPESSYIVPYSDVDALPLSAEGARRGCWQILYST